MSLTYAGYGVLVTIDPAHKWVTLSRFEQSCVHQATLLLLHASLSGNLLGRSVLCFLPGFFNQLLPLFTILVKICGSQQIKVSPSLQMFFAYTSDYSDSQQEGNRKFTRWSFVQSPELQDIMQIAAQSWRGYIQGRYNLCFRFIMAEGSVYFGAVAGSYASGLCYANFGYQVRSACKENYLFTFPQAVFFVSCGLNSLGLLYSLVYMSNIKQEKTDINSASEK